MMTIEISFSERDTAPERLERLAAEHGISVEQLVKRFIAEGLGDYGLRRVGADEAFSNLEEMLMLSGALRTDKK